MAAKAAIDIQTQPPLAVGGRGFRWGCLVDYICPYQGPRALSCDVVSTDALCGAIEIGSTYYYNCEIGLRASVWPPDPPDQLLLQFPTCFHDAASAVIWPWVPADRQGTGGPRLLRSVHRAGPHRVTGVILEQNAHFMKSRKAMRRIFIDTLFL